MGYKSTSLFQECSSNIQDKLIFITARNISSRFFHFEIKKSKSVNVNIFKFDINEFMIKLSQKFSLMKYEKEYNNNILIY